jgi:hypothetical protein
MAAYTETSFLSCLTLFLNRYHYFFPGLIDITGQGATPSVVWIPVIDPLRQFSFRNA